MVTILPYLRSDLGFYRLNSGFFPVSTLGGPGGSPPGVGIVSFGNTVYFPPPHVEGGSCRGGIVTTSLNVGEVLSLVLSFIGTYLLGRHRGGRGKRKDV